MGGSQLVRDYLAASGAAGGFYRGHPGDLERYREKALEVDGVFDSARRGHLESLITPAGPGGQALLERASGLGGYFVTTGQQPGLFGGPLYTLYKALTAVRLAEELSEALSAPVMPLFWVASDDHDWEESNHTYLIDRSNQLRRLTLGSREDAVERSLSRTPLGSGVLSALDEAADAVPANEFSERYLGLIRASYQPEVTVSEAFKSLLMSLLSDTPIGFVDAADPALKKAARPVLLRELETAEEGERVLSKTEAALIAEGYQTQVVLRPGGVNLFVETEQGRERLFKDGSGFRLGHSGTSLTVSDVASFVANDVETLSPNVLLRPVVESFLFPTLSYVGGPGEIAYFGQLLQFFEHHQVGAPIVTPRASLDVAESKVGKVLTKFGLTVDQLKDVDGLLSQMAKDDLPAEVTAALGRWRGSIGGLSKELSEAAVKIDGTLKGAIDSVRNASFSALSDLEKKLLQAVKRENETKVAQIRKAHENLWPGGKPQDRVLNPLHFLSRYGGEFLTDVAREIQVELGAKKG